MYLWLSVQGSRDCVLFSFARSARSKIRVLPRSPDERRLSPLAWNEATTPTTPLPQASSPASIHHGCIARPKLSYSTADCRTSFSMSDSNPKLKDEKRGQRCRSAPGREKRTNRVAIPIDWSSWKRSLAAYGSRTCEISVLFLHDRHSKDCFLRFAIAVRPQLRERRDQSWLKDAAQARRQYAHVADVKSVPVRSWTTTKVSVRLRTSRKPAASPSNILSLRNPATP